MNITTLINELIAETTQKSLVHFLPELALCATIIFLLLLRIVNSDRWLPTYWVALFGSIVAFGLADFQFIQFDRGGYEGAEYFFTGLLVYDKFTVFFRVFLLLFLILTIALTVLSGIPDNDDGPDFYTLLIGSTIGMMLMSSSNSLLMLFLGIEMTSVPSYVMVGFLKGRRVSSEAAFKYVVYGAGAAGVMLYGVSLIVGMLGTGDLSQIAATLGQVLHGGGDPSAALGMASPQVRTLVMAFLMVLVGIAFKLSLVPFHFWCPDAFEGAPAEVAGFLSVASKAAAFALLVRFCMAFVGESPSVAQLNLYLGIGLGVIAIITTTFGNLAAYAQSNIKRLLAYSTIAHAGYMLMAVSALVVIANAGADAGINRHVEATRAIEGLLYYLAVYLFMNLGAFAIVALIRNQIYSEEIDDYAGLGMQAPILCVCMATCMFSLVGMPPLGGFIGKLMIFSSVLTATKIHWFMWVVLIIGGLNTVFSLFYYVRVLKVMFLDPRPDDVRGADIPASSAPSLYVLMISLPVLMLGIFVERLSQTAHNVAASLSVLQNL